MSQAGILSVEGSNPQIPTSFETDSGTAIPIGNVLELLGDAAQGISSSGAGNVVTYTIADATTASKGVAYYEPTQFSVVGGLVSLLTSANGVTEVAVDISSGTGTNPVLPDVTGVLTVTGAQVAALTIGANAIRSASLLANSYTMQIQQSGSVAAESSPYNGIASFNSAHFTVSNGFVSLSGGGLAIDQVALDAGTSPISPNASGEISILATTVAAGTMPIQTKGTAANTATIEVQISQALASTDATKIGLSNYDSASFTVDVNGFVELVGGGFTWLDVSGAFSPLKNRGYFVTGTATGTLPAAPAQGDTVKFFVDHASQDLTIQAAGTQLIQMGNLVSSVGGTAVSTDQGDSVELVYRSSNTTWEAVCGFSGTWILA